MGAVLHRGPLAVDDVAGVADEFGGELRPHGLVEELGGLVLLGDELGLGGCAGAGFVVAGEGEEDDEAEDDGEAGGEDAEDSCRAVAVVEVAAFGGIAAAKQEGGDRNRGDNDDDEEGHGEGEDHVGLECNPTQQTEPRPRTN